ncbi:MAG: DNA topoisomerase-1, partial [Pseudoalteromonas tetraodonis]
ASVLAFEVLHKSNGQLSLKDMLDSVSSNLGNTPAIARNSYIHPKLIELCKGGKEALKDFNNLDKLPRKTKYLSRYERGLLIFLEEQC